MFKKPDAPRPSIFAAKASEAQRKGQQQQNSRLAFLKRLTPIPSVSKSSKLSASSSSSLSAANKEKPRAMSVDSSNVPPRTAGTPGPGLSRINSVRLSLIASVSRRRTRSSSSAAQEAAVKRQKENSAHHRRETTVAQEALPPHSTTRHQQRYALVCKTPVQTDARLQDTPSDAHAKSKKRTSFSLGNEVDRSDRIVSCRTGQGGGVKGESLLLLAQPNTNDDSPRFLAARRRPMSHFLGLATIISTSDDEEEYNDDDDEARARGIYRPRPWRQSTDVHQIISRSRQRTVSLAGNNNNNNNNNSDESSSSSSSTLSTSNHSSSSSIYTLNQQHQHQQVGRKHDPCSVILESTGEPIHSLEPRICKPVGIKMDQEIDTRMQQQQTYHQQRLVSPFPHSVPERSLSALCTSEVMFRPKRPTTRPARARTMIAAKLDAQQKKEAKAMNIWRNTVSQLIMQDDNGDHRQVSNDNSDCEPIPTSLHLEHISASSLSSNKNAALCKFIIHELYTTEKSYHQLLTLIQTRYMEPMVAAAQATNALVKEGDIPVLFRHLPEMIALSEKLIQSFEDTSSHLRRDLLPGDVGHVFRALDQEFAVFVKYAVHYQANIKTIRRACTNVLFLKIEQESLTRRETNRMGISDYLIGPFQRVPRYCLLIKDLIKHSGRSGAQCADLDIALKMLTGLTVAMDHVQKKSAR